MDLDYEKFKARLDQQCQEAKLEFVTWMEKEIAKGILTRHELAEIWLIQRISNLHVMFDVLSECYKRLQKTIQTTCSGLCSKCGQGNDQSPYLCQSCKQKKWSH